MVPSLTMSCSLPTLSLCNTTLPQHHTRFLSSKHQQQHGKATCGFSKLAHSSMKPLAFNPLKSGFMVNEKSGVALQKKKKKTGTVCYAAMPLTPQNLQWISVVSSAVLMIAKGTAVQKSYLVPMIALQAPSSIISWFKGEYGTWAAFLALILKLFFSIPGELELPLAALLLVITAPYQIMDIRGTQLGAIISMVITAYVAFQHFSRMGKLQNAFDQGSIVATTAVVCITAVSFLFLI